MVIFKDCSVYVGVIRGNLFIEFSAPKVMFGSNIYMLYPNQIDEVLNKVKRVIETYYNVELPSYDTWVLQRLDVCYAWRLACEDDTKHALFTLASYEYPRKKKTIIADESLTYWGTSSKVKFYRKHPEFKAHSFGRPKQGTYKYTNKMNLLNACTGVFRFEVTMFKKQIQQTFGEDETFYNVINHDNIESLLIYFLSQLVKTEYFSSIDVSDVYQKLEDAFGKKKAVNLFQFYNTWFCENKDREKRNRLLLDKALCTQTIKTRLDSISEAGIGIIDATMKDINFDLSIPSDLAVNSPTDNVLELLPKVEAPEPRHGDVKM